MNTHIPLRSILLATNLDDMEWLFPLPRPLAEESNASITLLHVVAAMPGIMVGSDGLTYYAPEEALSSARERLQPACKGQEKRLSAVSLGDQARPGRMARYSCFRRPNTHSPWTDSKLPRCARSPRQQTSTTLLRLHRVGSKEALWNAIIERQALYLRPFIAELKDLQKRTGTSIRARVETALRQMVEATLGNPECGMLLSRIISERGANLDLLVEKLLRPYHDALSPLLQEAIQAGVIRNQQLELLYFMIINAVTMTVSHRHLLAYFEDISQNMDRLKEDMIEVLIVNFLVSQA